MTVRYARPRLFSLGAYVDRWFPGASASGDERVVECPDCGRPKCYVNVRKSTWLCFRCEARGTAFAFVKLHQRLDDAAVARIVAGEDYAAPPAAYDRERLRRAVGAADPPAPPRSALPREYRPLPCERLSAGARAARYLERRGVTADQVATHRIGFAHGGRYDGRVILPVLEGGEPVYFVARSTARSDPARKYLNPRNGETPRTASEVLVNLDVAALYGSLTLVEGYFDMLAEWPHGVAMLGKQLSDAQVARLAAERHRVREVRVKPDGDGTVTEAGAFALAARVREAGYERVVVDFAVGDPAERRGVSRSVLYSLAEHVRARVGSGR